MVWNWSFDLMHMESPVFRLSIDIWEIILSLVNAISIQRLLLTGNSRLSSVVKLKASHFHVGGVWRFIDIEAYLRTCSHLNSLKNLSVSLDLTDIAVKRPVDVLEFPPTLTSLQLEFNEVFRLVPFDLSSTLPHLRFLSLEDTTQNFQVSLKHFDFPSQLETLKLLPRYDAILMEATDIENLPRSLTSLCLKYDHWPRLNHYAWPPHLSSLRLYSYSTSDLYVEHLPRTLTELHLNVNVASNFSSLPPVNAFPWRAFFPYLRIFSVLSRTVICPSLLSSLVLEDAFNLEQVRSFLTSGFWNLPSLPFPSKQPYPSYEKIHLPIHFWRSSEDFSSEFQKLAPYFQTTDFISAHGTYDILKLLQGTTTFEVKHPLEIHQQLPSSLTWLIASDVPANLLHSNIRHLRCEDILSADGADDGAIIQLPPELLFLHLVSTLRPTLASILPKSLTNVVLEIYNPEVWNIVASNLVSLKELDASLHYSWYCGVLLTPIASKRLENLTLSMSSLSKLQGDQPALSEFLSDPSILPSTVKILSIQAPLIHYSILHTLSKRKALESLTVRGFVWAPLARETLPTWTHPDNLTPEAVFQALPPRLYSLTLNGPVTLHPKVSYEILRALPPNILYLSFYGIFKLPDTPKEIESLLVSPSFSHFGFGSNVQLDLVFECLHPTVCSVAVEDVSGTGKRHPARKGDNGAFY